MCIASQQYHLMPLQQFHTFTSFLPVLKRSGIHLALQWQLHDCVPDALVLLKLVISLNMRQYHGKLLLTNEIYHILIHILFPLTKRHFEKDCIAFANTQIRNHGRISHVPKVIHLRTQMIRHKFLSCLRSCFFQLADAMLSLFNEMRYRIFLRIEMWCENNLCHPLLTFHPKHRK